MLKAATTSRMYASIPYEVAQLTGAREDAKGVSPSSSGSANWSPTYPVNFESIEASRFTQVTRRTIP